MAERGGAGQRETEKKKEREGSRHDTPVGEEGEKERGAERLNVRRIGLCMSV